MYRSIPKCSFQIIHNIEIYINVGINRLREAMRLEQLKPIFNFMGYSWDAKPQIAK
jgi:hypothetical protein